MKKVLIVGLVGLSVAVGFTGCAAAFQPKTPAQIVSESSDEKITKNFVDNLNDKKYKKDYRKSYIKIEQYISGEKGHTDESVRHAVSEYYDADSSSDNISRLYIKTANERGNTVKMYKNFVNKKLASNLPIFNYHYRENPKRLDLDVAFVEYTPDNSIKSVLVRTHYFYKSLGMMHYRHSVVAYGNLAKKLEQEISNSIFKEGYIKSFKPQKGN